jgi:hypothetical protein
MRLITHSEFVLRAEEMHDEKYKYIGEYKNSRTRIEIECPVHGTFSQTPSQHLKGQGCFKCRRKKPKKTELKF